MGHRTVKRVPLDFDAPLGKVWSGYVMPDEIVPPRCPDCDGTGYSPTARFLSSTFYDHNVADSVGGWGDKLTQADVDTLVKEGRLRKWQRREPTEDNKRGGEWVTVPRTADEVNAAQHGPGRFMGDCSHDSINVHILTKARCERLGADLECATCNGRAMVCTDEQYDAYENWEGSEPPTGEGWQLWETTSEGSPVSPVFETARALADWCETGATWFGSNRASAGEWLRMFEGGTTDVDTLLVMAVPDDR